MLRSLHSDSWCLLQAASSPLAEACSLSFSTFFYFTVPDSPLASLFSVWCPNSLFVSSHFTISDIECISIRSSIIVQSIEMNPQQTGLMNSGWNWGGKTVSWDEFFRRLGPEGCRDWVEKGQAFVNDFGTHAARSPAGTGHENIQQRGNTKAERTSDTKS